MLAASTSSSRPAARKDVITVSDDDDDDIDLADSSPPPQRQAEQDDGEAEVGFGDGDDFEGDGDDDADWGDMTEVNDEADIHALPFQHFTAHSSSSSSPASARRLSTHDAVSMESCPRDVMRRIEADVREISLLPSFCASEINFGGRTRVALRVGFPVRSLGMSAEQVRAWTLSNDMDLFVELHFPPYYWSVSANAIHVTVGQCATRAAPTDQSPLERCKLSWPLEYRIRKEFLPDLLHDVRPLPDAAWSWDSASEVVSTCDCSWLTAIQALVQCKNDQNRAIEAIVKEQAAAAEREAAAKPRGSKKTSSSSKGSKAKPAKKKPKTAASYISSLFTSSVADTAPDSPPVLIPAPVPAPTTTPNKAESSVMSACGVSLYVARRALALCNGAVEGAMDLLSSEQTIEDLEAEEANTTAAHSSLLPAASPSLVSNTSSSISFSSDAGPQSEEDQLLSLMAQHNYLVRLLRFIKQKIHRIHSTCMLCEKPLAFPGLNLSVCQSSLCRMSYESMGVGFDIGTAIAAAPVLTDLYISLLASAVSASHLPFAKPLTVTGTGKDGVETSFVLALPAYVAAPAPAAAAAAAEEEKKDSGPQLDYNKLTETIHRLPAVSAMVEHIRDGTFVEKMNALDPLILPLLRWLFQSCPTYVRELTPAERFASIPTPFQFVMLMSSPEREHSFQQLKAASGKPSMWAWHGGPSKNWHSIIRAGLKNMSNSKYMAHGAAYGQGIYMAKDSSTSLGYSGLHGGYSAASFGWNRSTITTSPVFLSLCEVVGDAGTFNPYLVVPDENKVSTRCLFVFGSQQSVSVDAASLFAEMHSDLRNFDVQSLHKRK